MRRRQKDPRGDPNSIGNILRRGGLDDSQLERALAFQDDNSDVLLGEVCVRLGFVSRRQLEVAIATQGAHKNGGARVLAKMATQRTRETSQTIDKLISTGEHVLASLCK